MELQVFNSTEFGSVRTATVNGEVMFVGKDVADILGYQNGSRDINRHVDEDDIVNIGLHFFHKDVRPMQLPVKKYSTVVA